MASLSDTIEIIFQGVDNVSEAAKKVSAGLEGLGDARGSIIGLAEPFANLADRILQTEAAITALGATLIGVGVNEAGKFNDSLNFTRTLFEATGPEVQKFKNDILDYASGSTQSLDNINAALQNAIGQGVAFGDSLDALRVAEKLAVAQGASLDDAMSLLAGTINGYGLKVSDASKLSDQFSVTIRDGKISVAELSSQLSNITPLAAAAGIGFDQVGAALAVLTAQGQPAGQAVTGVKQILEGIIKPTSAAADYAASLGLSFDSAALKTRGLQGVLTDVQKATGGSVDKFAQLFTTSEGLVAALALAGNGADAFAKELAAMADSTGVTDTAFQKMADNIGLGAQKIENALKVAFINLGDPLLDEFGKIQSGLAEVFKAVGNEFKDGGALRPITAALEGFGADIGDIIGNIARELPDAFKSVDLSGLISAYRDLGSEIGGLFKSFFGDIDFSTVDGLAAAVQKVVDSIEFLTRASQGIVGVFKPFAAAAGEAVSQFVKLDTESQVDFGQFLGAARAVVLAGPEIAAALILVGRTATELTPVFDAVFGGIKVGVNALQVTFDAVVLGLLNVKKTLLEAAIATLEFSNKFALFDSEIANNNKSIASFNAALAELEPTMDSVSANLERNKDELENGWAQATGTAGDKTEELKNRLDTAERAVKNFGQATSDNSKAVDEWGGGLRVANDHLKKQTDTIIEWATGIGKADESLKQISKSQSDIGKADALDGAITKTQVYNAELGKMVTVYGASNDASVKATGAFKSIGDSAKDTASKIDEAKKKSDEFLVKMEEIASNERIKTIEAYVKLNTAQLEADAKRVEATFKSIDTTIQSTGDLLGSLFGNLIGTDDPFKSSKIESQIDLENRRRQEALEIQKKLAEAEIDRIEAQTRALDRGDSIIKIDGTNLAPQLEAFMWEILKAIRVRANASFSDYLLGVT